MPRIRLLTRGILDAFAEGALANRTRLYRLWLIAPWFGGENAPGEPLLRLIEAARSSRCSVVAITSRPDRAWHGDAIRILQANTNCTLFYARDLHTKLYVMECDGYRCGVIGSPNLTARADRTNRELAVEVRSTSFGEHDDHARLLNDLLAYAHDLRADDGVELVPLP